MSQLGSDGQSDVISFMLSGKPWQDPTQPVSHIQTHGAHVFLCGAEAVKIKRAVRYDYMDLSTLSQREAVLRRELSLNGPTAPTIYRDVVPVSRDAAGGLALNGTGTVVEWALRMNRFAAQDELPAVAQRGALTDALAEALGKVIWAYHAAAPRRDLPGDQLIGDILAELTRVLAGFRAELGGDALDRFLAQARTVWTACAPILRDRSASGHVRRAHGDLHLRNIVLIGGAPVLFDALEFDEVLGTCDVLYDLAFLLMDLCHEGLHRQANIVASAYLLAADGAEDAGLSTLGLFMAVRAGIRAMVCLQTDMAAGTPGAQRDDARRYLANATALLDPSHPRLIAIGGVSGTGKTALALDLAPLCGPCPGAVHLRTDTERKRIGGPVQYDAASRLAIYDRMRLRAETLLCAGQSVVLDATFMDPGQRLAAGEVARKVGVPFAGLWLTAPEDVLKGRVGARRGDASDADLTVLGRQLAQNPAAPEWNQIDASGSAEATAAKARAALPDGF